MQRNPVTTDTPKESGQDVVNTGNELLHVCGCMLYLNVWLVHCYCTLSFVCCKTLEYKLLLVYALPDKANPLVQVTTASAVTTFKTVKTNYLKV